MTDHHPENDGASLFQTPEGDAEPPEGMDLLAPDAQPKTRPSDAEHATITHYAYDPQTFEMLCRPGQRLTPKKVQRLQELQLYAHVVTPGE
jgi:hypothetical protein